MPNNNIEVYHNIVILYWLYNFNINILYDYNMVQYIVNLHYKHNSNI